MLGVPDLIAVKIIQIVISGSSGYSVFGAAAPRAFYRHLHFDFVPDL